MLHYVGNRANGRPKKSVRTDIASPAQDFSNSNGRLSIFKWSSFCQEMHNVLKDEICDNKIYLFFYLNSAVVRLPKWSCLGKANLNPPKIGKLY